jgi:hypothetical protein
MGAIAQPSLLIQLPIGAPPRPYGPRCHDTAIAFDNEMPVSSHRDKYEKGKSKTDFPRPPSGGYALLPNPVFLLHIFPGKMCRRKPPMYIIMNRKAHNVKYNRH